MAKCEDEYISDISRVIACKMNEFYALGTMPVIKKILHIMFLLCVKVKSSVYSAKEHLISLSHYGQNLPFLGYCLSSLKSFRQLKQCE